jgi:hypothetical protein
VVGRHINTAQFLCAHASTKNNNGCDKSESIFPMTWMPYDGHFLEGVGALICKTNLSLNSKFKKT